MSFLRPVKMAKVGLVGLKDDRDLILGILHDLNVTQVETVSKPALAHVAPERASDVQRRVGEELVRFRGLRTALPAMAGESPRVFGDLPETLAATRTVDIDDEVGALKREEDQLTTQRKALSDEIALLQRHAYYTDRLELLTGRSIVAFFGEAPRETYLKLRAELPSEVQLLIGPVGDTVAFLAIVPTAQAETVARVAQQRGVTLTAAPRRAGASAQVIPELTQQLRQVEQRLAAIQARLSEIARRWYPTILAFEEALTIENRKLEVYTKLGAGASTFVLEGWVPVRDRARLEKALNQVTFGRVHFYDVPTKEEAPTLMDNPPGVRWYEFFIRFYSLPQANEWDPTWVFAVVFPIFFGFMLGDIGYGLVILGICLWMIGGFRGGQYLPKGLRNFLKRIMSPASMRSLAYALVPGCLVAIGAGIAFNEFFGFHVLPFPYTDPASKAGASELLLLAGYIGLAMVTFGFILGALKEYFHGHMRGALGKVAGIIFAWGIALLGLAVIRTGINVHHLQFDVGLGLALAGLVLLFAAEGVQNAAMGLIEVVSHILSYTRLVGILLASVILALVANTIGSHLLGSDLAVFGLLIIVGVAGFNIILGVFEPGIQGARLIFVENFSKYYTGNGKAFRPFGSRRRYTAAAFPTIPPAGAAPPPPPTPSS
jgi:V/A-type H+-transporting ATPase subunit I